MVVDNYARIFYVSVESRICIPHFRLETKISIHRAIVLSDAAFALTDLMDIVLYFNLRKKSRNA